MRSLVVKILKRIDLIFRYIPRLGYFRPLRGIFSAYEGLKCDNLSGAVIAHFQDPGKVSENSITDLAGMSQHNHQPWPVFWTLSEDARLVGKLLYWRNPKDEICIESCYQSVIRRSVGEDRLFAQTVVKKPVRLEGAWMSTVSKWNDGKNYFHWICDGLTRLMVREQLPEETHILIPDTNHSYAHETLEMLGLHHLSKVAPASCIQPQRFYFCSPSAMTGVLNPLGFDWLREAFRKFYAEPKSGNPIFLTRRGVNRVPADILEIEKFFKSNGFDIVDCSQISVKEQIQYCSQARAIAGIHGAAMTNILWSPPGTPILEIFQSQYINGCFEQIANQGKLNYKFIITNNLSDKNVILKWINNI